MGLLDTAKPCLLQCWEVLDCLPKGRQGSAPTYPPYLLGENVLPGFSPAIADCARSAPRWRRRGRVRYTWAWDLAHRFWLIFHWKSKVGWCGIWCEQELGPYLFWAKLMYTVHRNLYSWQIWRQMVSSSDNKVFKYRSSPEWTRSVHLHFCVCMSPCFLAALCP